MKKISIVPENPQYRIIEIFESLRDEGWNTDVPTVSVRLGKYSLACGWRDTDYLKFGMMSLSDILGRLEAYAARNIVATGGEPTIQPHLDALLGTLEAEGYFLRIETDGFKPAPPQIDYVATSSGACYAAKYETNCIAEADEVRIVASGDVIAFCENIERKTRTRHCHLSPCEQNSVMNIYGTIRQIGLLNGRPGAPVHWQLSAQTHKWAGAE